MRARTITAWLFALTMPLTAAAQETEKSPDAAPQAPQTQGPMTIERVHNGFAIAPEFKVTRIDGSTGRLAGGYGGWLLDDTLLIGGGAYWLTNSTNAARDMGYGGAVVEWLPRPDRTIGYAARGLVGVGTARLTDNTVILVPVNQDADRDDRNMFVGRQPIERFGRHTEFFIAEPQAEVLVRLTRYLRVDAGVGYRLIAGTRGVDNRLRGVTGSVSLQMGALSSDRR